MNHLAASSELYSQVAQRDQLLELIYSKVKTQLLYCAVKLGIADLLRSGSQSVTELAKATQTHAPSLYRLLRALANMGIFTEVEPETFAHTPSSQWLQSDVNGSLRGITLMLGSDWHNQGWANLLHSVRTGAPAFDHTFGMPIFDYFQQNEEASQVFNDAMTSLSNYQSEFISKAYDFSGCKTVVDVGGGHGFLLLTVLKDNPHLKGVLFDLPHVVAGALPRIELEGMNDRCETVGGNFLETAPAGGDIYMMKYIIHDWDDERCLRILQHCRRGMNPGGRVLVIDSVLPPDDSPYMGKYIDMEMLVFTPGGRERTEEQFHDLFRRAGLRLNRMIPTGMYLNIVEGVME